MKNPIENITENITRIAPAVLAAAALIAPPAFAQSFRDDEGISVYEERGEGYEVDFSIPEGVDLIANIAVGAYVARDESSDKINRLSVKSDGQIGFAIDYLLYNGMRIIGGTTWDLDIEPENYFLGISGGIGEIRYGGDINAAESLHVTLPPFAPHRSTSIDSAEIFPSSNRSAMISTYIEPETLYVTPGSLVGEDEAANMISYFSPSISGLRIGLSYIDDPQDLRQQNQDTPLPQIAAGTLTETAPDVADIGADNGFHVSAISIIGARYDFVGESGSTFALSYGVATADSARACAEPEASSFGIAAGFGGWLDLSASYFESEDFASNDDTNRVWVVGGSITTGNLTYGAGYRHSESAFTYTVNSADTRYLGRNEAVQIGANYRTSDTLSYGIEARYLEDYNTLVDDNRVSFAGAFVLAVTY